MICEVDEWISSFLYKRNNITMNNLTQKIKLNRLHIITVARTTFPLHVPRLTRLNQQCSCYYLGPFNNWGSCFMTHVRHQAQSKEVDPQCLWPQSKEDNIMFSLLCALTLILLPTQGDLWRSVLPPLLVSFISPVY